MTTYHNHLNPIFSHFNPDLTQSLLESTFTPSEIEAIYNFHDITAKIEEALYDIQTFYSKLLFVNSNTGEILHTFSFSTNPTKKEEELLSGFSSEVIVEVEL